MARLASLIQSKYRQIDRLALGCLLILAALLPYELSRPIVVLGPINLSSVEMVLYILIAVWLITRLAVRRTHWTSIHSAALLWIAAMGLSALFAPSDRADAIKFTLRSLGGCLLFFATVDIGRTPRRIAAVMTALALGTIVSALAGIAEIQYGQTVTGLTNGTTYRFRVQAINTVGTGAFSKVSKPATPGTASAPTMETGCVPVMWMPCRSTAISQCLGGS